MSVHYFIVRNVHFPTFKRLLYGVVIALLLSLAASLKGQSLNELLNQDHFTVQHWNSEDGLPQNSVNALVQTQDGYIWVGTYGGLARFDGVRFEHITFGELDHERIISLFEDAEGTLWIGTENNGIYRLKDDKLTHLSLAEGLPGKGIPDIFATPDGSIAAVVQGNGMALISGDQVEFVPHEICSQTLIEHTIQDPKGTIWMYTAKGLFKLESPLGKPKVIAGSEHPFDGLGIAISEKGIPLLANQNGLFQFDRGKVKPLLSFSGDEMLLSGQLASGKGQNIWYATREGGLYLLDHPGAEPRQIPLGTVGSDISCLYVDQNENLWIGFNGHGLIQLRKKPVQSLDARLGLKDEKILAIHRDQKGSIWIGTNSGSLYQWSSEENRLTEWSENLGGPKEDVWSIASDGGGNLWIGTYGNGLLRGNPGKGEAFQVVEGWEKYSQVILSLFYDTNHDRLLVGTDQGGLLQYKASVWTTLIPESSTQSRITQILLTQEGILYLATQGDGLKKIDFQGNTTLGLNEGLPSLSIRSVFEDSKGLLWVGTYGQGLAVFLDGKFRTINQQNGLYDNLISTLNEDEQGYFWISCNQGVFRVLRQDLLAVAQAQQDQVVCQVFNQSHGMGNSETNGGFQPASIQLADQTLLYPTMKGVAIFPTQQLKPEPPINHIHLSLVSYGDTFLPAATQMEIPKEYRDLKFDFTAPHFFAPELIRFEYRLLGYDTSWQSAGISRFARYTRLAPGEYTFQVRARNSQGILSHDQAETQIRLKSYLYEELWFQILLLFVLAAAVVLYVTQRLRQSRRREEKLSLLVDERTKDLNHEKELTEKALSKLAKQSTELEKVNKARTVFFANVSHELKTPLTLIKGPVEELLQSAPDKAPDQWKRDLELIDKNSDRLNQLITQLLDIARSEDGKIEVQEKTFDAHLLVSNLLETYSNWIEQKNIQIHFPHSADSLVGSSDPELMEKMVANLLSNALKFTPSGGSITLSLEGVKDQLYFEIVDSGQGVREEDLQHVFERFYKSGNPSESNTQGSGIGLALVKEFAQWLGGSVSVENVPQGGAKFSFKLPFKVNPKAESWTWTVPGIKTREEEQTETPTLNKEEWPLVLVVDDHQDIRQLVKRSLVHEYRILEASHGEEAFQLAIEHSPDVIVSDIMMPVMDGITLLSRLKNDKRTEFIAVLMLTARGADPVRMEAWKQGAEGYLAKPFNGQELRYRIQGILSNRKKLQAKLLLASNPENEKKDERSEFEIQFEQLVDDEMHNSTFSFSDVLGDFAMSRSTFQRSVKEYYNCSPQAYLKERRLKLAMQLIEQQAGSIAEVAYASGFNSASYFNRAFKERFGKSPTSFQ
ncbi:response regulator [bacterium SCSIO 12741]|nr:response regulator [bacterium SCSIO 12741]